MTNGPDPELTGVLPRWPVLLAVWSIPALLNSMTWLSFARLGGRPITVWQALVGDAPAWLIWAVLTPIIFILGGRFPIRRGMPVSAVLVHASAIVLAVLAHSAAATLGVVASGLVAGSRQPLSFLLANSIAQNVPATAVVYAGILGIRHALVSAARVRQEERVSSALRSELAEAQLSALRAQLQPHFLFNSLNAVSALVRDLETDAALEALELLGDLLRRVLRSETERETTLDIELDHARTYLRLMALRFSDRLTVTWGVPEELGGCRVPPLLLQPLLENAIQHGIARRTSAGRIAVFAIERDGVLSISVADDGVGPVPDRGGGATPGLGLINTESRLRHLYGPAGTVSLAAGPGGIGAVATVTLPARRGRSDFDPGIDAEDPSP